jgi:hypothetical protein
MGLHQRAGVAGVGFQVQHAAGVGVQHRVALDLLVAGQADHGAVARRHLDDLAGRARRRVGTKVSGWLLHDLYF